MDELVDRIRHAADQTGEAHFLELLRWHRVVAGLGEPDWGARGAYRIAIAHVGVIALDDPSYFLVLAARSPLRITITSAISCTSTTAASPRTPKLSLIHI